MGKAQAGNFFEDFELGATLRHPTPRTVHGGDLSLYIGLTGDRRPINSSTELAKSLGYKREVVHDLLAFHIVFGKSVGQISLNAVANRRAELEVFEEVSSLCLAHTPRKLPQAAGEAASVRAGHGDSRNG